MKTLLYVIFALCLMVSSCAQAPDTDMTVLREPVEEFPNRCPDISNVALSQAAIAGGEQIQITVTAVDPDNDDLFYLWDAGLGELMRQENQVRWTAPECQDASQQHMMHNITLHVSDGICTVDRLITIAVNCDSYALKHPDVTIQFPSGSIRLDNIAKAQLDSLASLLKQFPNDALRVEGHTDSTGSEAVNQRVGLKRAEDVKTYLTQRHGIDPARIHTVSHGSERPRESNETRSGRDKNRRVEIYRTRE